MTGFDEFWTQYPRKIGKGAARPKYARALALATHEEIMEGLERFIKARPWDGIIKYCPYPATWLHQERWDDEYEEEQVEAQPTDRQKLVSYVMKDIWRPHWPDKPTSLQDARERLERLGAFQYENRETKLRIVS